MTNEKIIEVCDLYQQKLDELKSNTTTRYWKYDSGLPHLQFMLPKIKEFVADYKEGKAFRWLGFVQGVLWSEGIYTIEELKKHNMPEGAEFEESH